MPRWDHLSIQQALHESRRWSRTMTVMKTKTMKPRTMDDDHGSYKDHDQVKIGEISHYEQRAKKK